MHLYVNSVLNWNTASEKLEIERVLWISSRRDTIALINAYDKKAMPRLLPWADLAQAGEAGEFRVIADQRDEGIPKDETQIPENHRTRRDESWQLIEPIVSLSGEAQFDPRERGAAIKKVLSKHKVSKTTIYHLLRRYWQRGQNRNALLPDYENCGGPGKERQTGNVKRGRPRKITEITGNPVGINIGPEERRRFELGIKAFYENRLNPRTFCDAYQLTLEKFFSERIERRNGVLVAILPPAEELPSVDQFRYWYEKSRSLTKALLIRKGERRFNLEHRALGGNAAGAAMGPGSIYQIDSTPLDVNLVSLVHRARIIARPTLYLVVDVFSRLICGFSVAIEDASYAAAGLALENAMHDKVQFCAAHGFEITDEQWPARHIPEMLVADRGEMAGKQADFLAKGLGITITNTPPYRADLKPFVERMFRTINDYLVHNLPGAVLKPKQRGERDPRLDAALNMDELRRLLITTILHYNRSLIEKFPPQLFLVAEDVERRPIDLWSWGVENRSGHLRAASSEVARLALLPGEKASVTSTGIKFRNVFYTCEKAIEDEWFVIARQRGSYKVDIGYDPRDASLIYLRLPQAKAPIPCRLADRNSAFARLTWDEVKDFFEALHVQKEMRRTDDLQEEAIFNANVASISRDARGKTKNALAELNQSKAGRLKNIREHRAMERTHEARKPAEPSEGISTESPKNIAMLAGPRTDSMPNDYVPPPDDFELLRRERDEQLD
jgi:putative transposase